MTQPLRDALRQCERHVAVLQAAPAAVWARWRALRGSLTYEYPAHPEIRAALLDEAVVATSGLRMLVARIAERSAG